MLLTIRVETKWHSSNKEWLVAKGYTFTKIRDPIVVNVRDLQNGSNAKVEVKCDYCGKTYMTKFSNYNLCNGNDCCRECFPFKTKETNIKKYGTSCVLNIPDIRKIQADNNRTLFDTVKNAFDERGYILLDIDYHHNQQKLKYICPNHISKGIQEISYHDLQRHRGCRYCGYDSIRGENHHNWNGGITDLRKHLRGIISPWVWDSYKTNGRKCILTGTRENIELHHQNMSFNLIIEQTLDELQLPIKQNIGDYLEEEIKLVNDKCLQLHYDYGLGVPLNKEVHFLFHSTYGFGNTTIEQWNEFVSTFTQGVI